MPDVRALLLVRTVIADSSGARRAARIVTGCGHAPAGGLLRAAMPVMPGMPELHVETFRARTMIMNSFGQ